MITNLSKIKNAIFKAAQAIGGTDEGMAAELAEQVAERIEKAYHSTVPTVEQVQDIVEETLIDNGHARTAKEYILYRAERTKVREMNTRLMKVYEDLTFKAAKDSDMKRENANIDGDTAMGTMLQYGSTVSKEFAKSYLMKAKFAEAHDSGDIHIHGRHLQWGAA